MKNTKTTIGFLTISDRAYTGDYKDIGGPAMVEWIQNAILSPHSIITKIVPDEKDKIIAKLKELTDELGCDIVLTTGGTGPTPRDVTPEATIQVCDRIYDGFAQQMRAVSLITVPTAILSRQVAGTRGKSIIINLPGKPEAISVCLSGVFLAIPKLLELLSGINIQIDLDFIEKTFA